MYHILLLPSVLISKATKDVRKIIYSQCTKKGSERRIEKEWRLNSFKGFRIEEEVSKSRIRDALEQKKNNLGS